MKSIEFKVLKNIFDNFFGKLSSFMSEIQKKLWILTIFVGETLTRKESNKTWELNDFFFPLKDNDKLCYQNPRIVILLFFNRKMFHIIQATGSHNQQVNGWVQPYKKKDFYLEKSMKKKIENDSKIPRTIQFIQRWLSQRLNVCVCVF